MAENMSSGGFSAGLHRQGQPAVFSGILDSGRSAPIFAGLKPLDFAIWPFLQAKSQAMPHNNLDTLRLFFATEWDQLSAEYIHKTCGLFRCHQQEIAKKNRVEIEKMGSQLHNTHKPVLSGLL
jgi:hypothetical protein